ncbi:MAG: SGNH/GDSL hydrolase family protein [Actinobacteria bacterium]|nr:SGNH/GDSL hydrolase family protein [Actinomycetota bacterium]
MTSIFWANRIVPLLAAAAVAIGLVATTVTPAMASEGGQPEYYLALGDSLAQGVQPDATTGASVPTDQGYADDLFAHYQAQFNGSLQLVKLGCPGETSTSMLTGADSPCTYPEGSQLAAALSFIRAHRSRIALVTIDIGANNVDGCAAGGTISPTCVASGIAAAQADLPNILGALRAAAGNGTVLAGMNLYDPFLADYLTGPAGQAAAEASANLDAYFNSLLAASFASYGMPVADVQTAFSTTDFADTAQLPGIGTVPLNVAQVCEWTWMCAPSPAGPNIHANSAGYQVIATAFEQVIRQLRS